MHIWGFNTFFRPHQREFGLQIGVVHPSLTRSLVGYTHLAVFHLDILARGGQNGVCNKLGGLRVMRACEVWPELGGSGGMPPLKILKK